MSSILLPSTRLSQPGGLASINYSDPITRGLVVAADAAIDLSNKVNGTRLTKIGGSYPVPSPIGKLLAGYSGSYVDFGNYYSPGTDPVTVFQIINPGSIVNAFPLSNGASPGAAGYEFLVGNSSIAGRCQFRIRSQNSGDISGLNDGNAHKIFGEWIPGEAIRIYADSLANFSENTTSILTTSNATQNLRLHSRDTTIYAGITGLTLVWFRTLSSKEKQSILDRPSRVFETRKFRIYFDMGAASGGAAVLEGSASGAASASGSLTTGIPIAGAALSVASASGTLAVGIPLAGAAASMSTASGSLTAQITLAGSALAQAVSNALLSSGITMTAAAVAQAAADGTLVTAIQLLGGAQAQAGASGSLTTSTGGLEGNAQASASASASLSAQIRLTGAAIATAGASGSLGGSANLAGTAVSTASASGELTVNIALTAQALASAIASGSLTAQIRLAADAAAQAHAGADLSGGSALVVPDTIHVISAPVGRQHRPGYLYGHRHGIKIGA